jgi:adenylate cyclase
MEVMRRRDAVALVVIALLSGLLFTSPAIERMHGLSLDLLTALRWQVFGKRYDPKTAPAVVIAIDEETYRTPPFKDSPTLTWTPEIARVLTAVLAGGAKVVGFDIIFPSSIEQSQISFGDSAVGPRLRGLDRDFLRALAQAARDGRVVLGEIQRQEHSIRPSPGQRIAVGQQRNIRALNVYTDRDNVVRRVPLTFLVDGKPVPSMPVELAARALDTDAKLAPDGTMTLASYEIPSAVPNTMTLNFEGGADDVATFSFADLHACAEKDDRDFFREHFAGKVVLIATLLDTEDRKVTSKRFTTAPEGASAPRCALPAQVATQQVDRNSISGVYIQATAVNDLLRGDAVVELGRPAAVVIAIAFATLAGIIALRLTPVPAGLTYLAIALAYAAVATFVFRHSLALPLVEPLIAGAAATVAIVAYRFVVTDREKRMLRRGFALYLAPQVIDKMIASNSLPALGGEIRNVTVFFSDIAEFSTIAEKMTPAAIVTLINEYLSAMTDSIEKCGGYVDKYIGDSIVAVFGAPVDDPNHAINAVRAALRCRTRLEELNRTSAAFQGRTLSDRIGINSGEALVGNIGSPHRFNYTVMSDAVNLASRLEGGNKYFGTSIMVAESTVTQTGTTFIWRELDAIRVKGRVQPVKIFEPLAEAARQTPAQPAHIAIYAEGLACWRARNFAGAVKCFESIAHCDPPSARFLKRARELALNPPGPDWEAVCTLEGK